MICILSWATKKQKYSRTFQGLAQKFKDFSRTSPKIQGLFKTVRTLANAHSNAKTRGLKKGDNDLSSVCMFITLTDMMDLMRWSSACVSILGYCGMVDYY